jgi:WWE domain
MASTQLPAGVEWQFSQETAWGTAWGSFDYDAALALEAAFTHSPASIVRLTSAPYEVDFEEMLQTNLITRYQRGVRRFTRKCALAA